MSDLQCAARLFIARHGEAEYESPLLSDHGGSLTAAGRAQARQLADALAGQRLARVWTSSMARAVQTAEIVAGRLGVDVVVREGLREFGVGDHAGTTGDPDPFTETFAAWAGGDLEPRVAGAERGKEVVERFCAVLQEVADIHRGESVLVVSHGGAICCAVQHLAVNLRSDHALDAPLASCGLIELDGDADGWVARSWAGTPLP